MTLHILLTLALAAHPARPAAGVALPRELTCVAHNTQDGKDRRCHVTIPAGASIRACAAADKAAGRCAAHPRARVVAWVVATGGAECRIADKRTDWARSVGVKVGKRTKPGQGTCALHVEVQ